MIRVSEISEAFRNATPEEKREFMELILPELVKNPEFNNYLDNQMIISDLKPIKRISELEKATGLYDFEEEEDHEPTLPERIKQLSEGLEHLLNKSPENIKLDLPIIPETSLEHKAAALVEHLKEKVKPRNNEVFLNSREIITFLKTEIPEELRLKDIKNPRQAKKDILEKAVKLFSNSVMIVKNKSGNKVTGIALKPSMKRMDTYGGC